MCNIRLIISFVPVDIPIPVAYGVYLAKVTLPAGLKTTYGKSLAFKTGKLDVNAVI